MSVTGSSGANTITTGSGNDTIDGGGGADIINFGAGDDTVNWLPAPAGAFRPVLRAYQPTGGTLDGSYQLPKVRRLS